MKRNKNKGVCETEFQKLSFDIRRTIILSEYMKHWEMPEFRQTMSRENERVELYTFPGNDSENASEAFGQRQARWSRIFVREPHPASRAADSGKP